MKLSLGAYQGPEDLAEMIALARANPGSGLHVLDLPYRLNSRAVGPAETTVLFRDEQGGLQGWCCLNSPFWTIDLAVREDSLYAPILDEASRLAGQTVGGVWGHPAWFGVVFEDQAVPIAAFEQAGFRCQSVVSENAWCKGLLVRDASLPVVAGHVPDGFRLRELAGETEAQAYVDLHRAAFQSTNMTLDWRLRTLAQPAYRPELDLVVEAPDGRLAGFLVGWLDARGRGQGPAGQVEPMGVHPDFQRRGLGRALLAEAVRRMGKLGACKVYVECDNPPDSPAFLSYGASGFELERNVLVYRKDFGSE